MLSSSWVQWDESPIKYCYNYINPIYLIVEFEFWIRSCLIIISENTTPFVQPFCTKKVTKYDNVYIFVFVCYIMFKIIFISNISKYNTCTMVRTCSLSCCWSHSVIQIIREYDWLIHQPSLFLMIGCFGFICYKWLAFLDQYVADDWLFENMKKKAALEKIQLENPGFDMSAADIHGHYATGGPEVPS